MSAITKQRRLRAPDSIGARLSYQSRTRFALATAIIVGLILVLSSPSGG